MKNEENDEDLYLTAPEANSIKGFIEALNIFSKYMGKGTNETCFCGAEHDELYLYVGTDDLPEESPDGRRLRALGFHKSEDAWAYCT